MKLAAPDEGITVPFKITVHRIRNKRQEARAYHGTNKYCKFFLPENNKVMGLMTRPMTE